MALFGMDLTTALLPFMAFIAFIGAMAREVMRANARRELTTVHKEPTWTYNDINSLKRPWTRQETRAAVVVPHPSGWGC